MTYEKAIKTIQIAKAEVEWNYPMDYVIAFDKAIEAMRRHIPQKPLSVANIDGIQCKICRYCSAIVEDGEWKANYCPECGQAIDWRK